MKYLIFLNILNVLQREFDENEVDPYHGQQDKRPEPEGMDLPDDLNLDQEEQQEEEEDGDDGEGKGQLVQLAEFGLSSFESTQCP